MSTLRMEICLQRRMPETQIQYNRKWKYRHECTLRWLQDVFQARGTIYGQNERTSVPRTVPGLCNALGKRKEIADRFLAKRNEDTTAKTQADNPLMLFANLSMWPEYLF